MLTVLCLAADYLYVLKKFTSAFFLVKQCDKFLRNLKFCCMYVPEAAFWRMTLDLSSSYI